MLGVAGALGARRDIRKRRRSRDSNTSWPPPSPLSSSSSTPLPQNRLVVPSRSRREDAFVTDRQRDRDPANTMHKALNGARLGAGSARAGVGVLTRRNSVRARSRARPDPRTRSATSTRARQRAVEPQTRRQPPRRDLEATWRRQIFDRRASRCDRTRAHDADDDAAHEKPPPSKKNNPQPTTIIPRASSFNGGSSSSDHLAPFETQETICFLGADGSIARIPGRRRVVMRPVLPSQSPQQQPPSGAGSLADDDDLLASAPLYLSPSAPAAARAAHGGHLPLPAPTEQGICVASTFSLQATNGRDPSRRISFEGFVQLPELLEEAVEHSVRSRGGEILLRRRTSAPEALASSLAMRVAVPLLFGVPEAWEELHETIESAGGIVHHVRRSWNVGYLPPLLGRAEQRRRQRSSSF